MEEMVMKIIISFVKKTQIWEEMTINSHKLLCHFFLIMNFYLKLMKIALQKSCMRFAEKNNIYVNNEKIALNCALKIKLQKYK